MTTWSIYSKQGTDNGDGHAVCFLNKVISRVLQDKDVLVTVGPSQAVAGATTTT